MKVDLSIVIANYNYGRFLEEAILSVVNQSLYAKRCEDGINRLVVDETKMVELIICDGGSHDESIKVIEKYNDKLAWWCSEKDTGQSNAFNKGFSHATGKFLTWLNADDIMLPGSLSRIMSAINSYPNDSWFAGGMVWCNKDMFVEDVGVTHKLGLLRILARDVTVAGPSSIFSRQLLDSVGGINEELRYTMDIDLWLKFVFIGHVRYRRLPHLLWGYRRHVDSKMSGHDVDSSKDRVKIWKERVAAERSLRYKSFGGHPFITRLLRYCPISLRDILCKWKLRRRLKGRYIGVYASGGGLLISNSMREYIDGMRLLGKKIYGFNNSFRSVFNSDKLFTVVDDSCMSDVVLCADYVSRHQINILYAQGLRSLIYFSRVRKACKGIRPIVLVNCHSPFIWESKWKSLAFVLSSAVLSDGIVFLVDRTKIKWAWLCNLLRCRIYHIWNPIDISRFAVKSYTAGHHQLTIGAVGVINKRKRQDILIRLVAGLRNKGYDVSVRIAGNCSKGQESYKAHLLNLAKELKIAEYVYFDGTVEYDDVPKWLSSLDLYVCPSDGEVMPFSILEAMATGLPVIAHDIAGIHEEVVDGETGYLIRSENVDEYIHCCEVIIKEQSFEKLGRSGRARVEERFTFQTFAQNMLSMINDLWQHTL